MRKIVFPCSETEQFSLGEAIEIYGKIYTGRDAALPKLVNLIKKGNLAAFGLDLKGAVIFHTAFSSAGIGPTSSNKMEIEDSIPSLSAAGVKIHLGKGTLSNSTVTALKTYQSYFAVTPPVSALFTIKIHAAKVVAFEEDGIEALHELEVSGIPAIIGAASGECLWV